MASAFLNSSKYLLTSESVTEGHPDKLCDQVSDSVVDAILTEDPTARIACETSMTNGLVVVMGEITTTAAIDIPSIVRKTLKTVGYTKPEFGIDYKSCGVMVAIQEQSKDIEVAVTKALEVRGSSNEVPTSEMFDEIGAGDQGMMVGFACNETEEMLPLPVVLSHKLCQQLALVRKEGLINDLWPDGKSQVTVEYSHGLPKRVHTVVISAQHAPDVSLNDLEVSIKDLVISKIVPAHLMDEDTKFYVNPSGRFVTGGPAGDTGLTGRKILVDTYGGLARHGGGAFSGKDPTKVDRSGAYAARYVAKNIVAAELADRAEVQVSYAIGVARPISISVETFGTNKISDDAIQSLVEKHFDLRPAAILHNFGLRKPLYKQVAAYGHFGRLELDLPWEKTDKAFDLKNEASAYQS